MIIDVKCKAQWNCLSPQFDFNVDIQNFIEYFYPLSFNFNADFQIINAEIPFYYLFTGVL